MQATSKGSDQYAQAGLSLCWSHIPHCWKSHATAQMMSVPKHSWNAQADLDLCLSHIPHCWKFHVDYKNKVSNKAKIRNRFNQVPHLTQDHKDAMKRQESIT